MKQDDTKASITCRELFILPPNTKIKRNQKYQMLTSGRICPDTAVNGGYMTLFACLLFLVMMGALFVFLDGMILHQSEAAGRMAAVGAGEHLLANYNVPLARRYHLYFLDPQMEGDMENRARHYYEELFTPTSSHLIKSSTLLKIKVKDIRIKSYGTMQEEQCLYLRHQIREYMKYDTAKDLLLKTVGQSVKQIHQQNHQIRDVKNNLDQAEYNALHAQKDTSQPAQTPSEQEEQQKANAQKQDPRKIVQRIMKSGVLGFVADGGNISEKKITDVSLPSGTQKEKNVELSSDLFQSVTSIKALLSEQTASDTTKKLSDDIYTYAYIKKYFNSYGKTEQIENPQQNVKQNSNQNVKQNKNQIENTAIDYEIEYIIGGQKSDKANLQYVVNRILMIRFGLNFIYAVSDAELNSQALALAAALVGMTGLPPVIEGVKYTILGAISFAEALLDVKNLLAGSKVPVLKNSTNWSLSITGASALMNQNISNNRTGLSYEEYLILLLTLQTLKNKMYLRMQDIMQMNIRLEQPEFLIEKCRFGFQMESQIQTKTPFLQRICSFKNQRIFSY